MKNILVVGSLNMDFVCEVDKMPQDGETIIANNFSLIPGGKGANKAYSLGKLGCKNVTMFGAVGNDEYGKELINNLNSVNVETSYIKILDNINTGRAFINVDKRGENIITVVSGANNEITEEMINENVDLIENSDIIILQLEIPIKINELVAKIAKEKGKTVILDPAPAISNLSEDLLKYIDIIKPNETEIEILSGIKITCDNDIVTASNILLDKGVKNVLVTLGGKGSILVNKQTTKKFNSYYVEVVDTTAAGDSYVAALAKSLSENKTLEYSIKYAHLISSIVVSKKGAQTSIPSIEEVADFLKNYKDKHNIIIDADPGIDDIFAIILALKSEEINIEGICSVAGNCSLDNATNNIFKILYMLQRNDIKVYKGSETSINGSKEDASFVHGNNGMGGITYSPIKREVEKISAVDYLVKSVNDNPNKLTIVALGPLTNIALAIKKDPEFLLKAKKLILMGGSINEGNITDFAEFNFYKDPEAAKIVFTSKYNEIIMLGLDVTKRLVLSPYLENILENSSDELAKFLFEISRKGAEYDKKLGFSGLIINDPVTIFTLTNKDKIKLQPAEITILTEGEQRGRSIVNLIDDTSKCKVGYLIDSEEFYKNFFKKVFNIDI